MEHPASRHPEMHASEAHRAEPAGLSDRDVSAASLGGPALALRQAGALFDRGLVLHQKGDLNGAEDRYRGALRFAPAMVEALCNLGNVLRAQARWDAAIDSYRRALVEAPEQPEIHLNLGVALQETGDLAGALICYDKALSLRPDDAEARRNRALALLQSGRLAEGWIENEWRWRTRSFQAPATAGTAPLWGGEPLEGKTILIQAEQGLGDTLNFVRYVPMVAASGAKVVLQCQTALASVLRRLGGADSIVSTEAEVPPHDVRIPLLSLPRIFKTTLENIPYKVPYLDALPGKVKAWRRRLEGCSGAKVGLVWAGDANHRNDRNRSMPAEALSPLLDVAEARFFSLQLGERRHDVSRFPSEAIADLSPDLVTFEETAAVIANLDLVIAVDTAVCHLAGALGRPVWLLLSVAHDWRWFEGYAHSPWYPTMRLFRQRRPGDWTEVVKRVAAALTERVALGKAAGTGEPAP